jgi:hypothetical protein
VLTNERTAGGAPLDPEEAALLAALRARGLNELAEMALHCFGESYGNAGTALREFEAAPPPTCSLGLAHVSLTPGAQCPSCFFIAPKLPPEIAAVHAATEKAWGAAQERRAAAMTRLAELEPARREAFEGRPILLSRHQVAANAHAVRHQDLEAWYLEHGVRCRVTMRRCGPLRKYELVFLEAELVP